MLKLLSESFKPVSHSGGSLFSPGKRDVSGECVTPDNTVTRLYERGAWRSYTGRVLGLWLVCWVASTASHGSGVEDMGDKCSATYIPPDSNYNTGAWRLTSNCPAPYSDPMKFSCGYFTDRHVCNEMDFNEALGIEVCTSARWNINLSSITHLESGRTLSDPVKLSGLDRAFKSDPPSVFYHYQPFTSEYHFLDIPDKSLNFGLGKNYLLLTGDANYQAGMTGATPVCQYTFDYDGNWEPDPDIAFVPQFIAVAAQASGGLYAMHSGSAISHLSQEPSSDNGTIFDNEYPGSTEVKHTISLDNFGAERVVSISIAEYVGSTNISVNHSDTDTNSLFDPGFVNYGVGETDFTVSATTLTIPEGTYGAPGQAAFDISFKPGGKGARQAVVNIDQDGENEIRFMIQGGTASPLQLRGGEDSLAIGDMDDTPEETEGTDFLSQKTNADPTTHTFTLLNKETRDITVLTELRDATTGFSLSEQSVVVPAATDEGVGSATFDVTFDPATTGIHETFVDLSYDGERQLSFKVSGEGEKGGGGAVSPLSLGLLGLLLAGLGYRRSRLGKQT